MDMTNLGGRSLFTSLKNAQGNKQK